MPRHIAALILVTLVAACSREPDQAPPVATVSVTMSRAEAAVGAPVDMTYRFTVAPDAPEFTEDHIVFVHVLDDDGERMWLDDHAPPTPTRQWQPGSTIEYTRTMFVPKFPDVGAAHVVVGLYSPRSGERLPLMGGATADARAYRVATFTMARRDDSAFVVFKDGWHDTEVAADGSGLEWQWTRRQATLSFRNPKRDAVFYLQADQPVKALPEPQRVEVRIGDRLLDSFTLTPGERELRHMALGAAELGSSDAVEMVLSVDQTFVPATVAQLRSSDHRELGFRVFRAYIEPK